MNEEIDLGVLGQEDLPWPDQPLEAEAAVRGRFGLNEEIDLGVLGQEDLPWPDQLLEADPMVGARFERPLRPPE